MEQLFGEIHAGLTGKPAPMRKGAKIADLFPYLAAPKPHPEKAEQIERMRGYLEKHTDLLDQFYDFRALVPGSIPSLVVPNIARPLVITKVGEGMTVLLAEQSCTKGAIRDLFRRYIYDDTAFGFCVSSPNLMEWIAQNSGSLGTYHYRIKKMRPYDYVTLAGAGFIMTEPHRYPLDEVFPSWRPA